MMTKFFLTTILLLFNTLTEAQNWTWATHFGSVNGDYGGPMCLDSSNNVYMTGNFSLPFGTFGSNNITTVGINDIYIVKINSAGGYEWAKRAGGDNNLSGEGGSDLIYDGSSSSIILTGKIDGNNEIFDSCFLGTGEKTYLSKIDLNGNCIWAVTPGSGGFLLECNLALDNANNIYMFGRNWYSSFFNGSNLAAGGFLAKFDSDNGNCLWVKNIFNVNNSANSIRYFDNSLYISGNCKDTLDIDTASVISNYFDAFFAKFDTTGNVQWVKTIGGSGEDYGGIVNLDASGNIYLSGTFKDTAYFDTISVTNGNKNDWYLGKFDNDGNVIWVEQIHSDSASGSSTFIDANSDIHVVGNFWGVAQFGNNSLTSSENGDLFAAKYNSAGICIGAVQARNVQYARIACDLNNDFYVCGSFTDTADFDGNSIISYGASDVFIAKHDAISGDPEQRKANNTLTIYANPTAGKCNITVPDDFAHEKNLTLSIYDNTGKLIQQKKLEMNEGKIKLNLEAEAKGIYNVTLSNGKKSYGGKIVFE